MGLTVAILNRVLDEVCRYGERLYSVDASSGFGLGVSPATNLAAGSIDDLVDYILSTADADVIEYLLTHANRIQDVADAWRLTSKQFRNLLEKTESLVRLLEISNVTSIETYLAYQNTGAGGTWAALQSPAWREIFFKWKGVYPALSNVYYEVTQGATFRGTTFTNALAKFVMSGAGAGAITDGVSIDATKYCGGTGKINMSGITGSGNITVTGDGIDPATGAATTGKTWITSVTGNGLTTMTVGGGTAPTGTLITNVTSISVAAGISAGTFYIEAHKPAGRLAVPF